MTTLPPVLPRDEMLALARTLREYAEGFYACVDNDPDVTAREAAAAFRQGDDLSKAARLIEQAVNYYGPYQAA